MGLTYVFLFVSLLQVNATPNSQPKISIDLENVTIKEVFLHIQSVSDYKFLYNTKHLDVNKKTSIKTSRESIEKILNILFKDVIDIDYEIIKNQVILKKRTLKAANSTIIRQSMQQNEVTGTVSDKNGLPLSGLTVYVSDREPASGQIQSDFIIRGTTTDFDGKFTLKAVTGYYLVVSGLGYKMSIQQITADTTVYDITLQEQTNELNEVVVVSSGYKEISKERVTGAYVGIKKSQLEKPASSISERLVGVVAGLQSTINPDGSIDFQVRGLSSLGANQKPLIVVDGFPIEGGFNPSDEVLGSGNPNIIGGFNTINPNDVESVTVLKDAAATSIWGAQAANGVIVITTKKGKKGKTSVSVSSFVRASSKIDLDYALTRASSADVIAYEQQAFDTDFFGSVFGGLPGMSASGRDLIPRSQAIVAMNEARLGRITDTERDVTLAMLANLDNSQQIKDYLLEAPLTTQHNISISGGNDRMTNSLSLLYEDRNGFYIGDETKRYLVNFNNRTNLSKNLIFDFGAMLQHNDIDTDSGDMLNTIRSLAPWDMLKNTDGSLTDMSYLQYYRPNLDVFVPFESFPYSDWSYNPIAEVQGRSFNTKELNARINAGLTLDIIKGLQLSSRIQYEIYNSNAENYYSDKTFEVRRFINETSGPEWNSGGIPTQLVPSGGILEQGKSEIRSYNFRNQLSFNRTFGEKHNIYFVGGTELRSRVRTTTANPPAFGYDPETLVTSELLGNINTATLWDFTPGRFANLLYNFSLAPEHQFTESTDRFFSLYGDLSYTFNDKYTIKGNYRTDASNTIAPDPSLRYNPFWSVGLGWNIGKEDFMDNIGWLDKLYIRSNYGIQGNIIPSASFSPLINLGGSLDDVTNQLTAQIVDFGNPELRWEETKSFNIATDFSILSGKINGSIDFYRKEGVDLLVDQGIPTVYGTGQQLLNNGRMVNKGIDISLGTYIPIKGQDIVWSGNFTFSHNKNEVTQFVRGPYRPFELYSGPTTSYREGFDANTLWAYQYAGLFDNGSGNMVPSVFGENGSQAQIGTSVPGDARNFFTNQGTTNAPTVIGIRNAFKIYDFDLSFIITGKFGHVFRRQGFNYYAYTGGGNTIVNEKYGEVANGDPNSIIPIPDGREQNYSFYGTFHPYMDYLTQDASHIRIQEVNLTYSLPKRITDKLGLNALSFYTQANNLGVILFNDFNEDPEFPKGTLRPQATYTFGMNLNF
ncbi:SusC/RagA family TonB-linked outer membrane protein [Flavivirga amylovorans]